MGDDLDSGNDKRDYIPYHLPPLPSKHTYLTSPIFTREPRVIREMATQEAMLAENALRKILTVAAAARAGGMNRKATAADGSGGVSKPIPSSLSTEGEKGAEVVKRRWRRRK